MYNIYHMKKTILSLITFLFFLINAHPALASSYSLSLSNSNTTFSCVKNDTNCSWQSNVVATNNSGVSLHNTKIWVSDPLMTYINPSGTETSEMTTISKIVENGSQAINTIVKVKPNVNKTGSYYIHFYIDGQQCNNQSDCYYLGAGTFTVVAKVIDSPTNIPLTATTIPNEPTPTFVSIAPTTAIPADQIKITPTSTPVAKKTVSTTTVSTDSQSTSSTDASDNQSSTNNSSSVKTSETQDPTPTPTVKKNPLTNLVNKISGNNKASEEIKPVSQIANNLVKAKEVKERETLPMMPISFLILFFTGLSIIFRKYKSQIMRYIKQFNLTFPA